MGIDFSHTDARWSYSGFSRARTKLAASAGITLNEMEGFGGNKPWSTIEDDIKDFLDHSDCDGELTPAQCRVIAPRIVTLVNNWPEDDYDKINFFRTG